MELRTQMKVFTLEKGLSGFIQIKEKRERGRTG
jgi:hypothetical protein